MIGVEDAKAVLCSPIEVMGIGPEKSASHHFQNGKALKTCHHPLIFKFSKSIKFFGLNVGHFIEYGEKLVAISRVLLAH
jgi:hypothetical protein